jgi:hypothetical protein
MGFSALADGTLTDMNGCFLHNLTQPTPLVRKSSSAIERQNAELFLHGH